MTKEMTKKKRRKKRTKTKRTMEKRTKEKKVKAKRAKRNLEMKEKERVKRKKKRLKTTLHQLVPTTRRSRNSRMSPRAKQCTIRESRPSLSKRSRGSTIRKTLTPTRPCRQTTPNFSRSGSTQSTIRIKS